MFRGINNTVCASLAVCAALLVPARVAAQTPVSLPPNLQALEQKMAQIRFSTARISARFALGEVGPGGGGAELGTGVKGPNGGFVTSTVGVFRLSPSEASTTSKFEGVGQPNGERAPPGSATSSRERVIGNTIYTYTPSAQRYDGGRPWVRSKRVSSSQSGGGSAGLEGLSDSSAPFAKLIEDVNGALSVQEVGSMTVDGQQVTEFTVSLTMATLLPGKRLEAFTKAFSSLGEIGEILSPDNHSAKQREEAKQRKEERAKKIRELPVEIELFVAPNGLPVRTITVLGNRNEAIGSEQDILALEVPVDVHAPPAKETIGETQLRKLRARRLCNIVPVHAASNASCSRAAGSSRRLFDNLAPPHGRHGTRQPGELLGQRPNQRSRRLEPKLCLSAICSADGALKVPVFSGPERKSMSTLPIRPAPNSM